MAAKRQLAPNVDRQQIAAIYAKALLGATEEAGSTEQVVEELQSFVHDVLPKFPNIREALGTPRITAEDKVGIIDRVFSGRAHEDLVTFLKVVAEHGRLDTIREIAEAARKRLNALRGRIEVTVTTADALNDQQFAQIKQKLETALKSQVDLTARVDADMIGGLTVRIGDTLYDGSLANQLDRLRTATLEHTYNQLRQSIEQFTQA
jgi:F-type H+-transporting ATPase subunit delta